jgi:hypothetical protein
MGKCQSFDKKIKTVSPVEDNIKLKIREVPIGKNNFKIS